MGFELPALKSPGELAGTQPVIIVDSREQTPLPFSRLQSVKGTLLTGDYSIIGLEQLFAVERKTVSDLVSCCIGDNRPDLNAGFTDYVDFVSRGCWW